jgi:dihydroorotase
MNPPLREARDRDAMLAGIADGSVDVVATDHAPHHYDEKQVEYDRAPFGIVGLETAISLSLDRLVHSGLIRLSRLIELMAVNPARILRIPGGTLAAGAPADITILAPDLEVTIDRARFRSRSRNTPFHGWTLRGGVAATIVGGRVVFANREVPSLTIDEATTSSQA